MLEILSVYNYDPWAWYLVRAGGLTAFLLLYISIFLAVAANLPGLRKIFLPLFNLKVHCWMSLQALVFVIFHMLGIILDHYMNFSLVSILIPGAASYHPLLVSLGILSFYLMLILVITSYAKSFMSFTAWRIIHFSNLLLYIFVLAHSFYLGTDLKSGWLRIIFFWANVFLILLLALNIFYRTRQNLKEEPKLPVPPQIIPPKFQ